MCNLPFKFGRHRNKKKLISFIFCSLTLGNGQVSGRHRKFAMVKTGRIGFITLIWWEMCSGGRKVTKKLFFNGILLIWFLLLLLLLFTPYEKGRNGVVSVKTLESIQTKTFSVWCPPRLYSDCVGDFSDVSKRQKYFHPLIKPHYIYVYVRLITFRSGEINHRWNHTQSIVHPTTLFFYLI